MIPGARRDERRRAVRSLVDVRRVPVRVGAHERLVRVEEDTRAIRRGSFEGGGERAVAAVGTGWRRASSCRPALVDVGSESVSEATSDSLVVRNTRAPSAETPARVAPWSRFRPWGRQRSESWCRPSARRCPAGCRCRSRHRLRGREEHARTVLRGCAEPGIGGAVASAGPVETSVVVPPSARRRPRGPRPCRPPRAARPSRRRPGFRHSEMPPNAHAMAAWAR